MGFVYTMALCLMAPLYAATFIGVLIGVFLLPFILIDKLMKK